jgi:hypothetical protein
VGGCAFHSHDFVTVGGVGKHRERVLDGGDRAGELVVWSAAGGPLYEDELLAQLRRYYRPAQRYGAGRVVSVGELRA